MDKIVLSAEERTETGKRNRGLRAQGLVPAVVYGHGVEPTALKLPEKELEKAFARAGQSKIIGLKIADGRQKNVIFQDVQQDGLNGHIVHADLYVVKMDEKIKTEVPLHFVGESTAVYQQEGTLLKNLETVEVEALPADLPESIEVDISILDDFEKTIHVSDLPVPANVTILADAEELVARVEPPRSEAELEELEAPVEENLPDSAQEEQGAVTEENQGNADNQSKGE